MAIVYALLCLLGSALNDFVFKRFATGGRSNGLFFCIVGILYSSLMLLSPINWETHLGMTFYGGCVGGLLSIVANLLLIRGMTYQSAGVCSTVYRLNLVPTILGAWLILGEHIRPMHWVGIASALGAIFCFRTVSAKESGIAEGQENAEMAEEARRARLGLVLVVIAAFLRAGMGLVYKHSFSLGANPQGVAFLTALFWVIGGLFYGLIWERPLFRVSKAILGYGLLSGLFVTLICFCMALSLNSGNASVVLPIAQMSFPCTFLLSVIFLHEKPTPRKILGILLGILTILLLTR